MSSSLSGLPPRYLRTPEAAQFLGLSDRTLEKHRVYGTGPTYKKLGGRVVYSVEDLQAWADRGTVTSTADPTPPVRPALPKYRLNPPLAVRRNG
ncbi:helix-turn-helix transcriptional regulator [Plastorhodobacter daqingensis]|uniref:Helix-turn-helix transcriptional regulator n=1 Tax=Plastorhodobacter daqingensis TaxID=1387281 RepID=A0ABW2US42_9RHOB